MGFFDNNSEQAQAYNEVTQSQNTGSLSHEALGGAAAFAAARAYEQKCERDGRPQSHALAKEMFAGLVGAELDKLVETKGLDFIDREKAKRAAEQHAQQALSQEYQ